MKVFFIVLLALFQSFTDDDGQDDLWPLSDFVRSKELSKFINSRRIPLLRSKQESTEQRLMTAYYSSLFCKNLPSVVLCRHIKA